MDLRATRYLPDIARLQQCLYDKFNRQVDKKDSRKLTVGLFIEELPSGGCKLGVGLGTTCLGYASYFLEWLGT